MSNDQYDARAMRAMVRELRSQEPPELPWDTIERRLFARIDQDQADAEKRASQASLAARVRPIKPERSSLTRVFGFAVAAAVMALGIGSMAGSGRLDPAARQPAHRVDTASVALAPGPAGARGDRELLSLLPGSVVEAGDAPISFGHEGVVTWTLEPHGVVEVRSMGKGGVGHVVALRQGSLHAEVTPRAPSEGLVEAFAVEVDGTRVAVHGTAFTVTREANEVTVDVEHGAVAVGPVGHVGETSGHLLVGPSRASFSLDGGRIAHMLPPAPARVALERALDPVPAQAEEAKPAPVAAAASPAEGPADSVAPAPRPVQAPKAAASVAVVEPPAPAPEPAAPPPAKLLSAETVRARLGACFQKSYDPAASSVRVSVSSTFRLDINADGTVRSARFDPPLKPEFQVCAGSAISGRFPEGARSLDIPVSFSP